MKTRKLISQHNKVLHHNIIPLNAFMICKIVSKGNKLFLDYTETRFVNATRNETAGSGSGLSRSPGSLVHKQTPVNLLFSI